MLIRNTTHRYVAEIKGSEEQGWVEYDTHNDADHLWEKVDAATPPDLDVRVRDRVFPQVVHRR